VASEADGCLVTFIVIGIAIWGGGAVLRSTIWGEQEGVINTDDCRARIVVKEDSSDTWFKKFTCTYRKTNKGTLISGVCQAVETTGGKCETVYFYDKVVPKVCTDPKYPNLGVDDMCYTLPQ
jgi:hypothetical protein